MPDENLEILVKLTSDTSGGKEAKKELDGLNHTAKETAVAHDKAGEATERHSVSMHKLHKLYHGLNELLPGLGTMLQFAFSPVGASISLAVMGLKSFLDRTKELNAELKRMDEEAAKPLTNRLEAMRDGVVRTASTMATLQDRLSEAKRGHEGAAEAINKVIAALHEELSAAGQLAEARKGADLAELEANYASKLIDARKYSEERLRIEKEYLEKKRSLQEQEQMRDILMRRRAVEEAEVKQPGLEQAAKDAAERKEMALTDLASIEIEKQQATERKTKAENELKAFEEGGDDRKRQSELFRKLGTGKGYRDVTDAAYRERVPFGMGGFERYSEWDKLMGNLNRANEYFERFPTDLARRQVRADREGRGADRAASEAEKNQEFITSSKQSMDEQRAKFDMQRAVNAEMAREQQRRLDSEERTRQMKGPIGGVMAGANALWDQQHGRPITVQQESQILLAKQIAASLKASGDGIMRGNTAVMDAVNYLLGKVNKHESDMRRLSSQIKHQANP